jgi:hypothetical protein
MNDRPPYMLAQHAQQKRNKNAFSVQFFAQKIVSFDVNDYTGLKMR